MSLRAAAARTRPRIAINGRFVDEVQIAMPKRDRSRSRVSFPAEWHHAEVAGDEVALVIRTPVVVQLYFDGTLSADRTQPVVVQIGDEAPSGFLVEAIEANDGLRPYEEMILRLRRAPAADAAATPS